MSKQPAPITNPTQKAPLPEIPPPTSPHCGTDLKMVRTYGWQINQYTILAILCSNLDCRVLLQTQIFQRPPQQAVADSEQPAIWTPS